MIMLLPHTPHTPLSVVNLSYIRSADLVCQQSMSCQCARCPLSIVMSRYCTALAACMVALTPSVVSRLISQFVKSRLPAWQLTMSTSCQQAPHSNCLVAVFCLVLYISHLLPVCQTVLFVTASCPFKLRCTCEIWHVAAWRRDANALPSHIGRAVCRKYVLLRLMPVPLAVQLDTQAASRASAA